MLLNFLDEPPCLVVSVVFRPVGRTICIWFYQYKLRFFPGQKKLPNEPIHFIIPSVRDLRNTTEQVNLPATMHALKRKQLKKRWEMSSLHRLQRGQRGPAWIPRSIWRRNRPQSLIWPHMVRLKTWIERCKERPTLTAWPVTRDSQFYSVS